jgi:hypothetical protein
MIALGRLLVPEPVEASSSSADATLSGRGVLCLRGHVMQSTYPDPSAGIAGLFGSLCCFAYIIPVLIAIAGTVFWIVTLVDVLQRNDWEFPSHQQGSGDRVVWVLVVLLLHIVGAIIYYFVVMKPYPRSRT